MHLPQRPVRLSPNPRAIFGRTAAIRLTVLAALLLGLGPSGLHAQDSRPIQILRTIANHRAPYLMEFRISLFDLFGNAVVVDPDRIRLVPRENDRLVNAEESGAIVLRGGNRQLDSVVVLDYSRSMATLTFNPDDNANGVSDTLEVMENGSRRLFSRLNPDARSAIIEFHNGLTPPSLRESLTSSSSRLVGALDDLRPSLSGEFSGSTRVWDGIQLAINTLTESGGGSEQMVFYLTDGEDESSQVDPVSLAAQARAANINLVGVLFNDGELIDSGVAPLGFVVQADGDTPVPRLIDSEGEAYQSGEARLKVARESLGLIPDEPAYAFMGPPGSRAYIIQAGIDPVNVAPIFSIDEEARNLLGDESVNIRLVDFSGPGDFSLSFSDPDGQPLVAMSTVDGLGPEDQFRISGDGRAGSRMSFTRSGDYRITLEIQSTGNADRSSTPSRFQFGVNVAEDIGLATSGVATATFGFDGAAWTQTLTHAGGPVDTSDFVLVLGPENHLIIDDSATFPFISDPSVFLMEAGNGATSLGFDLTGILPDLLQDDMITLQLVDFDGPGDMFAYEDPGTLIFDTSDGVGNQDAYVTTVGTALQPFWAFTAPGDYRFSFQVTGTIIDPEEDTASANLDIAIRVVSDSNILLTSQTGGDLFQARDFNDVEALLAQRIFNLQGQYHVRWSTLKRGDTPFTPSFDVFLGGEGTRFTGEPVTPADLDGSILDGRFEWQLIQPADPALGTQLTLESDFIPRDFSGLRINYASLHPFTVEIVPPGQSGLIPDDWSVTRTDRDGVGLISLSGPRGPFGLDTLPFTAAGRLIRLQFEGRVSAGDIFYEFAVASVNSANGVDLTNAGLYFNPRTSLIHGTSLPWLETHGFTGSIPELVVMERSDPDGDTHPTWLEYIHGTDPNDLTSRFYLEPSVDATGRPVVEFSTARFRRYTVEATTDLIEWQTILVGFAGTGNPERISDPLAEQSPARFYRVQVAIPESIDLIGESEKLPAAKAWLAVHSDQDHTVAVGVDGQIGVLDQQNEWHFPSSPTDQTLWDVVAVDGTWIAVGNDGVILSSADGTNWNHVEDVPDVPFLWSVAANDNGRLVAVGYRGGILTSTNGSQWTEVRTDTTEFLRKVIWDGNQFHAVGGLGVALRSGDGIRWFPYTLPSTANFYDLAWSGSRYVVVGTNGTILTGPSMNNLQPADADGQSTDLYAVTWADGRFIATTSTGQFLHSEFGTQWTPARPSPDHKSPLWDIHATPTKIIAVGAEGITTHLTFKLP